MSLNKYTFIIYVLSLSLIFTIPRSVNADHSGSGYGTCVVRNEYTYYPVAPPLNQTVVGDGYAIRTILEVNDYQDINLFSETKALCTDEIYEELMDLYSLSGNTSRVQWGFGNHDLISGNVYLTGCAASGCEWHEPEIVEVPVSIGSITNYIRNLNLGQSDEEKLIRSLESAYTLTLEVNEIAGTNKYSVLIGQVEKLVRNGEMTQTDGLNLINYINELTLQGTE